MMPDVLTVCTTRGRPNDFVRMVRSFEGTIEGNTKLVAYVSDDDTKLEEYRSLPEDVRSYIEFGPKKYLVDVYNYFSTVRYPEIAFYQELHDDHICHTKGWDVKMMQTIIEKGKGWGVCCANDLCPWTGNPGGYMISGNIIRVLGYWLLPTLRSFATDVFLRTIIHAVGIVHYLPDVIIEHRSWHAYALGVIKTPVPEDENTKWAYGAEETNRAGIELSKWDSQADIAKLRKAVGI